MFPSQIPHLPLQSARLLWFISVPPYTSFPRLSRARQGREGYDNLMLPVLCARPLTVWIEEEFQGKPQRRTLLNTFIETRCSQNRLSNHIQTLSTLQVFFPEAECWLRGDTFLTHTGSLWLSTAWLLSSNFYLGTDSHESWIHILLIGT